MKDCFVTVYVNMEKRGEKFRSHIDEYVQPWLIQLFKKYIEQFFEILCLIIFREFFIPEEVSIDFS